MLERPIYQCVTDTLAGSNQSDQSDLCSLQQAPVTYIRHI